LSFAYPHFSTLFPRIAHSTQTAKSRKNSLLNVCGDWDGSPNKEERAGPLFSGKLLKEGKPVGRW
jgi:hypothetical protein